MFLSKENIIMDAYGRYTQIGNLFDETQFSTIDICAIKTSLIPTIKIPEANMVMMPSVVMENNKPFIKNEFLPIKSAIEGDFVFIPKIDSRTDADPIPRTVAWLYGKYIVSGYPKNENGCTYLMIPVKRISPKEEKEVQKLDSTFVVKSITPDFSKIIITKNNKIINDFLNFTRFKKIKDFMLFATPETFKVFLNSILCETDNIGRTELQNQVLAHEIFIHSYSKLNKILKISEERNGKKRTSAKSKKKFFISQSVPEDYDIFSGELYTKILSNRYGNNTFGINIEENELYDTNEFICNSIIVKTL